MEIKRKLSLSEILKDKSYFLFGPRATGKSFLIQKELSNRALIIDLLDSDRFMLLSARPSSLEEMIQGSKKVEVVVIDEVQKIPALLDEVHRLIESKKIRFLLTGSSARKLKYGNANLLAGRAWKSELFPLSWSEIKDFKLSRYLRYGGLPAVWLSEKPEEELDAYVQTYLNEEIRVEGLIRKLAPFTRFLITAALSNGKVLNFTKIANDSETPASTVREYFSILEDTLVGFMLEPWTKSKKRKAIQTAKFYFFDTGVTHTLARTKTIDRNSNLYGESFEQFIAMELRAYLSYKRIKKTLNFWRTSHGEEVDFIIGDELAIEVKSSKRVTLKDLQGLNRLKEEKVFQKYILVSQDRIRRQMDGIDCIPWEEFLQDLWEGRLVR